jgi:hypothetical protein
VPRGWGRHGPLSRFDFLSRPTAHSLRSVAWSYPVTPLAAFALSGAFDKWDAINPPNLVSRPGMPPTPQHAGMDTSGRQVDGRGLVHAWSTTQRSPAVAIGMSFAQVPDAILGNRPGCRTLIRMRFQGPDQSRSLRGAAGQDKARQEGAKQEYMSCD